jgi:predicted phage terminase large subunit-like protein
MSNTNFVDQLADALSDGGWRTQARPSQLPPPGDWLGWIVCAGRGFGKTRCGAEWVTECVMTGTASRVALCAPTAADSRDVMIEGPSGLLAVAPSWFVPTYEPSKRKVTWPNGAVAYSFSSEEPDRLRGPQFDLAYADELAAWTEPQAMWDMLMFGLRLGTCPRWLITTTPRPIRLLKELLTRVGHDVVLTTGSTFENSANLAPSSLQALRARYEGTRLGRQELHAELLEDTPGALWQRSWIDATRVAHPPELVRIVVAVDPAVSTSEGADETGIIVAGVGVDNRFYVLADLSGRYGPDEWARRAISAFNRFSADRIVVEKNQGGDMVANTIRSVDPGVPLRMVHASRGKITRAEPISALYEQGRVSHVGSGLSTLEDQLCSFTSDFDRASAGYSPDRLDALVWGLTELAKLGQVQHKPVGLNPFFLDGNGVAHPAKAADKPEGAAAKWQAPSHWLKRENPWDSHIRGGADLHRPGFGWTDNPKYR